MARAKKKAGGDSERLKYLEESLAWIKRKLGLPPSAEMFTGDPTIAGALHVVCAAAHGYNEYVTSYRCDDKQGRIAMQAVRINQLADAIRKHMNTRGDDRCTADDGELYAVLPEGDTRPESDTAVTIENCRRYIECLQQGREYISPQRRIEELESLLGEVSAILPCEISNTGDDIKSRIERALDATVPAEGGRGEERAGRQDKPT